MKTRSILGSSLSIALAACVPPGNSTPSDAGTAAASATATRDPSAFVASTGIMAAPFEDTFDRKAAPAPAASSSASAQADAASGLVAVTATAIGAASGSDASGDDAAPVRRRFERDGAIVSPTASAFVMAETPASDGGSAAYNELGPDWNPTDPSAWHLEHGKLCGSHAHNHGVWLNKVLPINARIEFDAVAETEEGDLKGEFWGDGRSFATSLSYTNATGYLAIMGGWHNTFDVIARHNEHGTDRKELKIDKTSDDPAEKPVEPGQTYRFKIERTDGKTVKFAVNNIDLLSYADMDPVKGAGHDHFAFNDWDAKVCFDNLKITPLP